MNNNIKVGDLITAYWKGLYEVVKIERRWKNKTKVDQGEHWMCAYAIHENYDDKTCGEELPPLVHVIQKYSSKGKPVKSTEIEVCSLEFCKPAKEFLRKELKHLREITSRLENITNNC